MNSDYHSYLVRIWRPDPESPWRILVESIPSRERHSIHDWSEMLTFLQQDVGQAMLSKNLNWNEAAIAANHSAAHHAALNRSDAPTRHTSRNENQSGAMNASFNADDSAGSPKEADEHS